MFQILRDLFGADGAAPGGLRPSEPEAFRLACAVLLVEVMRAEPDVTEAERQAVMQGLRRRFPLGEAELERLVTSAEEASRTSSDFHRFTSELNDQLDAGQKAAVVETLWQVAYADGRLGDHEQHLVSRIAGLLHVPHGEYIAAKLRAKEAAGSGAL